MLKIKVEAPANRLADGEAPAQSMESPSEMKKTAFFLLLITLLTIPFAANAEEVSLVSAERTITVSLRASQRVAFALFGPVEEQKWTPDWRPRFLFRSGPPEQPDFAVMTNGNEDDAPIWVISAYDKLRGYIQYVSFRPGKTLTLVSIQCFPARHDTTRVRITYRRTALRPESNAAVEHFAAGFTSEAQHWENTLNEYLQKRGK
jgi:hypothetical protein